MNGNLHNYMKVGIVQFMAFPATAKGEGQAAIDNIKAITDDPFFGGIEVTAFADAETRKTVSRILKYSGLAIGFGGQPVMLGPKLDPNSVDEEKRVAAVTHLKAAIDQAAELGASKFAILSGTFRGEALHAQATVQLLKSLDELATACEAKGMSLVVETFDREIDKKALLGPTHEAVEVAKKVREKHPTFGLMIDLSHLPQQFETSKDALTQAAPYIVHAHIGNCVIKNKESKVYGDLHPRFGCEDGENDVPQLVEFLRQLMAIGYIGEGKQNVVAFEVKPYGDETPETLIAQSKRVLMEAWAKL
jgi:sugar phosphate isomerase/epimerase